MLFRLFIWLAVVPTVNSFGHVTMMFGFGQSSSAPKLPKSPSERDRQAIAAIQAAILSPSSYPLIECEFPPLQALNKLGDGSFKSANMVDNANLQFCSKLVNSIVPPFSFPTTRPKSYLLTSSTATSTFVQTARTVLPKSCAVMPMSASTISELLAVPNKPDLCVLVAPSVTQEYAAAHALASRGLTVVLVNGLAKDPKSVSDQATFAYFFKPLTYNLQVAGYLLRAFPNKWLTIDASSGQTLGSFADKDILVPNTNTPDLRASVRLVQKAVDQRAILARGRN